MRSSYRTLAGSLGVTAIGGYKLSSNLRSNSSNNSNDVPKSKSSLSFRRFASSLKSFEFSSPAYCYEPTSVANVSRPLVATPEQSFALSNSFIDQLKLGLETKGAQGDFRMLDSCVEIIPTGKEQGVCYAVDFGGTNLRVVRVKLNGIHGETYIRQEKAALSAISGYNGEKYPKGLMDKAAPASALFGHMAFVIKQMMSDFGDDKNSSSSRPIPIGFTYSFPLVQTSLTEGVAGIWTKGFETGRDTEDKVEGREVAGLLQKGLDRHGVNGKVMAVCNDTVGTLLSSVYEVKRDENGKKDEEDILIGLILGTGVNACYIQPNHQKYGYQGGVVNIEMGNFSVRTRSSEGFWSSEVDGKLPIPPLKEGEPEQGLEKMMSGRYIGELTRLAFKHLCSEVLQHQDVGLLSEDSISSAAASVIFNHIHNKERQLTAEEQELMSAIVNQLPTEELRTLLYHAVDLVFQRSARLAALSVWSIARFSLSEDESKADLAERGVVVCVDGSLFTQNPKYVEFMNATITEMNNHVGQDQANRGMIVNMRFVKSEDGSGKGAAVAVAAIDHHNQTTKQD